MRWGRCPRVPSAPAVPRASVRRSSRSPRCLGAPLPRSPPPPPPAPGVPPPALRPAEDGGVGTAGAARAAPLGRAATGGPGPGPGPGTDTGSGSGSGSGPGPRGRHRRPRAAGGGGGGGGAAAVPRRLGRLRRAAPLHPAQRAGGDPRLPRHGPPGPRALPRPGPPAAPGAGAEALQDHDAAQHHGPHPLRVPAPGPHLLLHDQLRRGGDARGQRGGAGRHRPGLRAVPRGGRAHVPRLPPGPLHGPVLRQRQRPRQRAADAGALRLPRPALRHHLLPAGHPDPPSRGGRLRHQARQRQPGRGLLLRRGGRQRGGRPRRLQLRRHPRVPHRLLLPQQRLRHLHPHLGAVPRRRHRGPRPRLRAALHPRGRQRRLRRLQRDQGGAAARCGREPALPHRGHDLQDRPPQHQRRQLGVPLGGRGQLLGQAGPPHLPPAPLHAGPGLVGRGAGEELEEELPQEGDGGLRGGRAQAEAQPAAALLRRLPGDAAAPAEAAGSPGAAPAAVRRALPARALRAVTATPPK